MGLRKRVSAATVGCQASEADPVERGENILLRSSAPFFVCVRDLRDPAAGNSHDSLAVGVDGWVCLPISVYNISCNWLAEQLNPKKLPRRDARVHRGGVMKVSVRGSICAFLCANAPILRGILKGPPSQGRSLKSVSLELSCPRRVVKSSATLCQNRLQKEKASRDIFLV